MNASRPDVAGLSARWRRARRAPAVATTRTALRRFVVVLVRWVIPSASLLAAAAYVWAAVVWQANPPGIPIVGRSMQPTLWAGDLVVVRAVEPDRLRVGDVVTVRVPETDRATWGAPEYVTHRIVKIDRGQAGLRFHTRGDNNKVDDPFLTRGPSVHGRKVLRIPKLGMLVLFFMSRQGLYSVAGLCGLGVLWLVVGALERRRIEDEDTEATLRAVLDEVRHVSHRLPTGVDGHDRAGASASDSAGPANHPAPRSPVREHPAIAVARGLPASPRALETVDPVGPHLPEVSARAPRASVSLPPLAMDVRGRAIIVTGATGRMGGAVARALHAGGARLTLTGRDPERLQELLEELPGALVVRADLRRPDMPEKLVQRALRAHGSLHGLVNAAAIGDDGELLGVSDEVLADVLSANVLLPIRLIRAAAPHLESGGFICNLGARPPAVRGSGATVQATARATLTVMSSVLEWELVDRGIRMLDVLADAPARRSSARPIGSSDRAVEPPARDAIVPAPIEVPGANTTPVGASGLASPVPEDRRPGDGHTEEALPVDEGPDAAQTADDGEPSLPPALRVVR